MVSSQSSKNVAFFKLFCYLFAKITRTPPDEKRRRQANQIAEAEVQQAPAILQPCAFGPVPFLSYENIPLGRTVSRLLIIRNPSRKPLQVRGSILNYKFPTLFAGVMYSFLINL